MATISRSKIRKYAKSDIIAGLTVAILVIPQAMGYALIAGMPPILGLYTSFIPLLIYPLFGSSPHIIVGCAAIPSMMLFSAISPLADPFSEEYVGLATMMTFLVGLCLILLRLIRFGNLMRLISRPVVYGYTAGAAILILISQIRYILKANLPSSVSHLEYFTFIKDDLSSLHLLTIVIGVSAFVLLMTLRRINKKIPSALLVLILGVLLAYFLNLNDQGLQIVGSIPAGLPSLKIPFLKWDVVAKLLPQAVLISLVAYVQSIAIAKTFALDSEEENVHADKELFALGASNLISSFFQCFPNTGSLTKSAVNHDAGSQTGFSSIVAGALIGVVLLFLTSIFYFLPNAVLAAIIIVAVLKFIDIKGMKTVFQFSTLDFIVLLITLLLTLFVNIHVGVFIGILLSLIISIVRLKGINKFASLFMRKDQFAMAESNVLRITQPILYINADVAYQQLKKQIKTTGCKIIKSNSLDHDLDGINTLRRLSEEMDVILQD